MPSHLVLHIGPHKTGSTAVQRMLGTNRERLAEAGIHFPEIGFAHWGQHGLARALADDAQAEAAAILDRLSRLEGRVVLSSEVFSTLAPEKVARLAESLPAGRVEIVYYQRSLVELPPRIWQEAIRHGGTETFPEHLVRMLVWAERHHLLNPVRTLDAWAGVFGRDAVRIARYAAVRDVTRDFARRFLPGVEGLVHRGGRANPGLDAVAAEAVRRANLRGGAGARIFGADGPGSALLERLRAEAAGALRSVVLSYAQTPFEGLEARLSRDWGEALGRAPGEPVFRPRRAVHAYLPSDFWADNRTLADEVDALAAACPGGG